MFTNGRHRFADGVAIPAGARIGLAAVTGTLDAGGNTPSGEPAPIPGSPALRDAVIKAAFDRGGARLCQRVTGAWPGD